MGPWYKSRAHQYPHQIDTAPELSKSLQPNHHDTVRITPQSGCPDNYLRPARRTGSNTGIRDPGAWVQVSPMERIKRPPKRNLFLPDSCRRVCANQEDGFVEVTGMSRIKQQITGQVSPGILIVGYIRLGYN